MKNVKKNVKYLIGVIVSFIIVVICIFVSALSISEKKSSDSNIVPAIFGFLGISGIIATIVFFLKFRDKLRSTCDKCGSSLEGCIYQSQLVSNEVVTGNEKIMVNYKYEIECTCPNCGEKKVYFKTFRLDMSDNPEYYLRKYLERLYKY